MPRTLALITGASSGLGAEYARQLAAGKCDLILTARRKDKLQAVASEVRDAHGVQAEIVTADLSKLQDIQSLAARVAAEPRLDLLINNAGYGFVAPLRKSPLEQHLAMNSVHMTATLALSQAALQGMVNNGAGEIINVSSIAAWLPFPGAVSYSASKAYLNMFSEGMQMEVKDKGVHVQCLAPGFTRTGFHSSDDWGGVDMSFVPEEGWMQADEVVRMSLAHSGSGKGVILIAGDANRTAVVNATRDPYWAT